NTHGVAEDSQGRIYIKHTVGKTSQKGDAVVVFDPDGKFIKSWGAEFRGGAHGMHLVKENGVEFFYLCDTARHLLVKTTLDGEIAGHTSCPHGLMVDRRGAEPMLVVADRGNRRLQYFNLSGEHVKFVTEELRAPCHFHTQGDAMVIPDLESRVTIFDKENKLV